MKIITLIKEYKLEILVYILGFSILGLIMCAPDATTWWMLDEEISLVRD